MLLIPGKFDTTQPDVAFMSKYAAMLDIVVRAGDVVIALLSAWLCYWIRFDSVSMSAGYLSLVLRGVLLVLLVFPLFGVYRSWRGQRVSTEIGRLSSAWVVVAALLLVSEWTIKDVDGYSRLWMACWFASSLIMFGLTRWIGRRLLGLVRLRGMDKRSVVVVGGTQSARKILKATEQHPDMGLSVIGYVRTPYDQSALEGVPCIGNVETFIGTLRRSPPDQIWVALPLRAEETIRRLVEATSDINTTLRLVPDLFGYELINHGASTVAGVPVITLRGSRVEGHAQVLKAIEDRVLAALLLLALSPLMLALAVAVKFSSPGPVFYRQKRHGMGGREIEIWKFRSMRVHEEQDGQVTQASRNDSRVTPLGRFLRSTSLDELPQFINVLQGRMSIVGPRPHAVAHNHYYSKQLDGYMQRHGVKPGLTGLAQVRGFRGETDSLEKMVQRVECDISYINHWSVWLDLKIILTTPFVLIRRTNAY